MSRGCRNIAAGTKFTNRSVIVSWILSNVDVQNDQFEMTQFRALQIERFVTIWESGHQLNTVLAHHSVHYWRPLLTFARTGRVESAEAVKIARRSVVMFQRFVVVHFEHLNEVVPDFITNMFREQPIAMDPHSDARIGVDNRLDDEPSRWSGGTMLLRQVDGERIVTQ